MVCFYGASLMQRLVTALTLPPDRTCVIMHLPKLLMKYSTHVLFSLLPMLLTLHSLLYSSPIPFSLDQLLE